MDQQASASASVVQTPEEDIHQRAAELVAALQNPEEMATEDLSSAISNAYEAMAEWRQEWVTLQRSTRIDALPASPLPKPRTRATSNEDSVVAVGTQAFSAVAADPAFVASSEFATLPYSASAPILRPAPVSTHTLISSPDFVLPIRRKRGRPRKEQSTPPPNPRTRATSNEDSTPPVQRKSGRPRKDQSKLPPNTRTRATSNKDSIAAIATRALPAVAADPVFVPSTEFSTLPYSTFAPTLRPAPVFTHTLRSSPDVTPPVRRKRGRPRKNQSTAASAPAPAKAQANAKAESSKGTPAASGNNGKGKGERKTNT